MLAGILGFTDKVISEKTRQYIKEMLGMTQVGRMLMDEGRQEGRQPGRKPGRESGNSWEDSREYDENHTLWHFPLLAQFLFAHKWAFLQSKLERV